MTPGERLYTLWRADSYDSLPWASLLPGDRERHEAVAGEFTAELYAQIAVLVADRDRLAGMVRELEGGPVAVDWAGIGAAVAQAKADPEAWAEEVAWRRSIGSALPPTPPGLPLCRLPGHRGVVVCATCVVSGKVEP